MKRRSEIILAVVGACTSNLVYASLPARSDISPVIMHGGQPLSPMHDDKDIEMSDESVQITANLTDCSVDATFHMRNYGKNKTIEVGFPYHYEGEINDFHAYQNGVLLKQSAANRNTGAQYSEYTQPVVRWKTFKSNFPHGQSTIRVTFRTPPLVDHNYGPEDSTATTRLAFEKNSDEQELLSGGSIPCFPDEDDKYWSSDQQDLASVRTRVTVRYILQSGKNWRGKIGHCLVKITAPAFEGWQVDQEPCRARKQAGSLVWDLRNIDPTSDVIASFHHEPTNEVRAQTYEKIARAHLSDFQYCAKTCSILIALEHKADAIALAHQSLAKWTPAAPLPHSKFSYLPGLQDLQDADLELACFLVKAHDEAGNKSEAIQAAQLVNRIKEAKKPIWNQLYYPDRRFGKYLQLAEKLLASQRPLQK